jgi:hypothetical protein
LYHFLLRTLSFEVLEHGPKRRPSFLHTIGESPVVPLFIATRKFDAGDGRAWINYLAWSQIPDLVEVVSLDGMLCPRLIDELCDEDWAHNVHEDYRLTYFRDLSYLRTRVGAVQRCNILGLYRNPPFHSHVPPAGEGFDFIGYDLIEEATQISALTNCGGFPHVFSNRELNRFGLIGEFTRAREIMAFLPQLNPNEPHANCELYAVWRLPEP